MALEKWNPFKELDVMRREIDHLWDEFSPTSRRSLFAAPWRALTATEGVATPAVDVIDRQDSILVRAELPGVDKDKIDINVEDDNLIIKCEIKDEKEIKKEEYYHCERSYRSFARTIALPMKVEARKVKATFKDGILDVTLPKAEDMRPRRVHVDVK
ncbi:MAG: Hsp20/alpha crystallin family protein [Thermodesulfobacteriota bacterium]